MTAQSIQTVYSHQYGSFFLKTDFGKVVGDSFQQKSATLPTTVKVVMSAEMRRLACDAMSPPI